MFSCTRLLNNNVYNALSGSHTLHDYMNCSMCVCVCKFLTQSFQARRNHVHFCVFTSTYIVRMMARCFFFLLRQILKKACVGSKCVRSRSALGFYCSDESKCVDYISNQLTQRQFYLTPQCAVLCTSKTITYVIGNKQLNIRTMSSGAIRK